MSGNIAAATRCAATGRPLDILLWCVQAFLALVFVSASWAKLMGKPEMVALFTAVGFGQWFRYVTGILELTGAVLIMVPKTRRIGSALLATIMLGALTAHLFILHVPPTTPGVLFLMSGFVVWDCGSTAMHRRSRGNTTVSNVASGRGSLPRSRRRPGRRDSRVSPLSHIAQRS
jgi:putative oxidoreductase